LASEKKNDYNFSFKNTPTLRQITDYHLMNPVKVLAVEVKLLLEHGFVAGRPRVLHGCIVGNRLERAVDVVQMMVEQTQRLFGAKLIHDT
jgi:hypothetical protein